MKPLIQTYLFFLLSLVMACTKKQEKTLVAVENITESVYASGIVKSKNQYQVFSSVSGLIQHIFVTEGDILKIGDPIIEVVNKVAQFNTDNARIAANFNALDANTEKLTELKINIDLSKIKKENDSLQYERQRSLWDQKIGSQNEFEQRELAFKNSSAAYKANILRSTELQKQLYFAAQQSKKILQISTTNSNDFIVRSNINGKVYDLPKKQGEMVNPQTILAVVGDDKDFILELQIDEYDIAKIKLGQKIFISMDSYKGQVFEAQVNKIYPIMNDRLRSFKVEAQFTTKPPTLYPNLTVEANIVIQTKEKVLIIPSDYLIDDTYVLTKNKQKVKVQIGLKDYQKVEILSGIIANDVIYKPQ